MDLFGGLLEEIIGRPVQPIIDTLSNGFGIVTFVLAVGLVYWLFRDARRRGTFTTVWGVLGAAAIIIGVFFGFFISDSSSFIVVGAPSLLLVLIVIAAYSIMRPAEYSADAEERELSQRLLEAELDIHACPSCGSGVEVDFLICPSCNVTLRRPCDYCSRPIKTSWSTCPYCLARKGQAETRAASAPVNLKGGGSSTRKRSVAVDDDFDSGDIDFGSPKSSSSSGRSSASRSSTSGRTRSSAGSSRDSGRRSSGRTSTGSSSSGGRSSSGSSAASATSTFKD